MKPCKIIMLLAVLMAVGCTQQRTPREPDNFKPYIYDEQESLPTAYPDTEWQYPAGTSTHEVVKRWRMAGLVMGVRTPKNKGTQVDVGPQFYNLSPSSQRGLAKTIAQLYGLSHYTLMDVNTDRAVGTYAPQGLHMY